MSVPVDAHRRPAQKGASRKNADDGYLSLVPAREGHMYWRVLYAWVLLGIPNPSPNLALVLTQAQTLTLALALALALTLTLTLTLALTLTLTRWPR